MSSPAFISQASRWKRFALPIIGLLGLALLRWMIFRWSNPDRQLSQKQTAFFQALERRRASNVEDLLSLTYRDQWQFDRNSAVLAMQDATSHFISLAIQPIDLRTKRTGREAVTTARLQVSGSGTPLAGEVIRQINTLRTPFVFTWKRESIWPSSWRLVKIENAALSLPPGYEPGTLRGLNSLP